METEVNTNLETNHIVDFSDRLFKLAIAIVVVAGIFFLGQLFNQFGALPQNAPHEITVSGTGKAYIKPDIAVISFGVNTQALKSQDAVNQNNAKMNAVIKAVKDSGVSDKDIQTTLYNLTPLYDYKTGAGSMGIISGMPVQGGRIFSGYSLDQQITVKIRNFDNINTILDKAATAGANTIGELQFTVDNPEMAQSEARAKAIAEAKTKLQDMAKESGLEIGKLVNISEGYNYPQPMYASSMAKDSSVAPQIQTGQMEVDSNVSLTYQVK